MASALEETSSAAIDLQLTKDQVALIWPGLGYIVAQQMSRREQGYSITRFPFYFAPPPPGYDSSMYSEAMMQLIIDLDAKIYPIKDTGGQISVDEFELRATVFAARTSINLERYRIRRAPKKGADAQRRIASAKQSLKRNQQRKSRLVEFLENERKRATRKFRSVFGAEVLKARAQEWKSHLKWVEINLTYFKPPDSPMKGRLARRRWWLQMLHGMAEQAIVEEGYQLPDPAELREVIQRFLDYSLRGRIGEYDHMFMTNHSDSGVARLKLLDFVQKYLVLQEAL